MRSLLTSRPRWYLYGWRLGVVLAGAIHLASLTALAAAPVISKEYLIKAAFLYNFTKFVEWPPERFPSSTSPIVIGVLGKDPFGAELENIVRGRKVNGRSIAIVHLSDGANAGAVHVLFLAAGEERLIEREIGALTGAGVLTVGESQRFLALGGAMMFTDVDDKVRFEINVAAAGQGGLKVSAQLQKLASAVRR